VSKKLCCQEARKRPNILIKKNASITLEITKVSGPESGTKDRDRIYIFYCVIEGMPKTETICIHMAYCHH
jgi:hypothetical protein